MNYIKNIYLKNKDNTYNVVIEIPKGTNHKYELCDNSFDHLCLVRNVIGKYPFYYGCFPQTFAGDGDPLDMILFSNKKRNMLDIVEVQPIGVIKTLDNGYQDDKVLVIPVDEEFKNLSKLKTKAIKFLHTYKGKDADMVIDEHNYDSVIANQLILEAYSNYAKQINFNALGINVN